MSFSLHLFLDLAFNPLTKSNMYMDPTSKPPFVHSRKLHKNRDLSFWSDNSTFSNALLFLSLSLSLSIVQNNHRGPTFHAWLLFFPTKWPLPFHVLILNDSIYVARQFSYRPVLITNVIGVSDYSIGCPYETVCTINASRKSQILNFFLKKIIILLIKGCFSVK